MKFQLMNLNDYWRGNNCTLFTSLQQINEMLNYLFIIKCRKYAHSTVSLVLRNWHWWCKKMSAHLIPIKWFYLQFFACVFVCFRLTAAERALITSKRVIIQYLKYYGIKIGFAVQFALIWFREWVECGHFFFYTFVGKICFCLKIVNKANKCAHWIMAQTFPVTATVRVARRNDRRTVHAVFRW